MLKRILIAAMLIAIPTMAYAQGGGQRGQRGQRGPMAGPMGGPLAIVLEKKVELELSADQVVSIEAMATALAEKNEPHVAKMREMRQAGQPDREAMMKIQEAIRENNVASHEALKDVLSEEQLEMANRLIAEARPRGRRGGGGF
jgi:hypothetical protein